MKLTPYLSLVLKRFAGKLCLNFPTEISASVTKKANIGPLEIADVLFQGAFTLKYVLRHQTRCQEDIAGGSRSAAVNYGLLTPINIISHVITCKPRPHKLELRVNCGKPSKHNAFKTLAATYIRFVILGLYKPRTCYRFL